MMLPPSPPLDTRSVLGAYAVEPANFAIPLLGAVDDLILLPLLLHAVARLLPAEIRYGFERQQLAH